MSASTTIGAPARRGRRLVAAGVLACLAGCQAAPAPAEPGADDAAALELPANTAAPNPDELTPENNTPRAAAMMTATMPPVADPATLRAIRLHAALYRQAHADNVGDITDHFILEPFADKDMGSLDIDRREFRLRVLAELVDLRVPMAWTPPDPSPSPPPAFFPGTRSLATRIRIAIEPHAPNATVVRAELADFTGHVGSSRQTVRAVWTGTDWSVERVGARVVW